jgi:hypothetical protein
MLCGISRFYIELGSASHHLGASRMSSYTGIYVHRLASGEVYAVQVRDTAAIELSIDPATCQQRLVQPPLHELTDLETYRRQQQRS